MNPMLDIGALQDVHNGRESSKIQTFNTILSQCHQKIIKYNKEYLKMECYFLPPVNVYGRPMYNRTEVIVYIIQKLRENGFNAFWDTDKREIYINWKPTPSEHGSGFENDSDTRSISGPKITYVDISSSDDGAKSKKSKKNKGTAIQHMALVNYGGDTKDLIPVSVNPKRM